MKALYILRPSERTHEHVQAAFESGAIDLVMLMCRGTPDSIRGSWEDTHEQQVEQLRRWKQYGRAVPVVHWQIPSLPHTHPLNQPVERIREARRLVQDSGAEGMIWDVEDYRGQSGDIPGELPRHLGSWTEEAGVKVLGGMPWSGASGGLWFAEATYEKNRWYKVKPRRWFGDEGDICPGAWIEQFDRPEKYIRKLHKCYDGNWWIYSHVRFGQRIIQPVDYVDSGPLPLSWWELLP